MVNLIAGNNATEAGTGATWDQAGFITVGALSLFDLASDVTLGANYTYIVVLKRTAGNGTILCGLEPDNTGDINLIQYSDNNLYVSSQSNVYSQSNGSNAAQVFAKRVTGGSTLFLSINGVTQAPTIGGAITQSVCKRLFVRSAAAPDEHSGAGNQMGRLSFTPRSVTNAELLAGIRWAAKAYGISVP
jgi:hypothetical protein